MMEYRLHGWAESGNTYKVAMLLAASGADWEPVKVSPPDCQTPEWRARYNELGEVPVLEHKGGFLSQSAVILDYIAAELGRYVWKTETERREVQRWLYFDNHKVSAPLAYARFRRVFLKLDDAVAAQFQERFVASLGVLEKHFSVNDWVALGRTTVADFSLPGYLFFDPAEINVDWARYPNTKRWLDRIAALPNWRPPYEMLPRARG
jgi:glutathione S-transferase